MILAAVTWFAGIGYLVGEIAPRAWTTLFGGWAFLAVVSGIVGMIVKNVRVFAFFSGLGLLCCVIYVLVRST